MQVPELVGLFVFIKFGLPGHVANWRQYSRNGFPFCNGKSGFGKTGNASYQYLDHDHTRTC